MAQGARGRSVVARRDRFLAGSAAVVCAACSLLAPSEDEIAGVTPGSGTGAATATGGFAGAATGGTWASGGTPAGGTAGSGGAAGSGAADASAGTGASGGATGGGGTGATGGATGGGGTGATGGTTGGGGTVATGGTGGTGGITWWNTAYKSRFPLSVKNESTGMLPIGLQIGVGVLPAQIDGTAAPWAAWRIVRLVNGTWSELPRHVETVKTSSWIWWRAVAPIDGGKTDTSYWLYAANPTAPMPAWAQSQIFEFFDGFTSFDNSKWASMGVVTAQGEALLIGGSANGSIRSFNTFGTNTAVDFRMAVLKPLASSAFWFSGGYQRTNDFTDIDPWIAWISRYPASIRAEAKILPMNSIGPEVPVDAGNLHVYSAERFTSKMVFRYDFNASSHTANAGQPWTEPMQLRFTAYDQSQLRLYYARVRKAIDPPPSVLVGSKETYP